MDTEETAKRLISLIETYKWVWERYQAMDYLLQLDSLPQEYLNYFSDLLLFEQEESIRDKSLRVLLKYFPESSISRVQYFLESHPEERYKDLVIGLIDEYYHPSLEVLLKSIQKRPES